MIKSIVDTNDLDQQEQAIRKSLLELSSAVDDSDSQDLQSNIDDLQQQLESMKLDNRKLHQRNQEMEAELLELLGMVCYLK